MKKRVTGIGGIFFKAKDRKALMEWYQKHLGIEMEEWGASFPWKTEDGQDEERYTAWSIFDSKSPYMEPSEKEFMINYQVENLHELRGILKEEGVNVFPETEESEFGKFGWILDPEGQKIELWEPPKSSE